MRRLIYSPHVQAYVKSDEGVFDLSPYIVRGGINRKVNQVSAAQLTIRNPVIAETKKLLFTEYPGKNGEGPLFHPQDPIIILLTRLQGHPVQVFTGYIDKSPYVQFYPGLCTIEASCSLKRLLYTQWDAALPFVRYFLEQYGWVLNSDSGIVNPTAEEQRLKVEAGQLKGQFNDGSIGALLFAVLNHIGNWDESTIWIEALPPQIKDIVSNLYHQIEGEVKQGEEQFKSLLTQILGTSSQGAGSPTGSGSTGNVKGLDKIIPTMISTANAHGIPPLFVIATWIAEGSVTDCNPNSSNARGYFQFTSANPYPGVTVNYPKDACDLGLATDAFCRAAADAAKHGRSNVSGSVSPNLNVNDQGSWEVWAEVVQDPGPSSYSNRWGSCIQQAQQYITQYGKGSPVNTNTNNGGLAPTNSASSATQSARGQTSGTSPGGKSGKTGSAIYALPLERKYMTPFGRIDDGLDIENAPAGAPVFSITDGLCTAVASNPSGFGPNYPVIQVTNGPYTGQYIYYGHVATSVVHAGQRVKAGDRIAIVGFTGDAISLGHGHIEIGFSNASGDPLSHHGANAWTPDGQRMADLLTSLVNGTTLPQQGGGTPAPGTGSGGGSDSSMAAAFSTFINLPSIFDTAEALAFTGKRSFMADQPLFPFIEQLCQASMRNFMSMPNGNFFAFFPDYFGFFGRKFYWEIRDIEIIDGRIDLSDDPLVTHVAVAGDVTQYHGQIDVFDMILTSGIFDIFDAFATGYVGLSSGKGKSPEPGLINPKAQENAQSKKSALAFLQKYGARPYVEQAPMIRSPIFELFLAFQKFMLLWSKQFQTTFELTFMPELFPGGLIAFPDHHIQCYIEEVAHNFDYEQGFTTTVNLSSPSILDGSSRSNISEGVARSAILRGI